MVAPDDPPTKSTTSAGFGEVSLFRPWNRVHLEDSDRSSWRQYKVNLLTGLIKNRFCVSGEAHPTYFSLIPYIFIVIYVCTHGSNHAARVAMVKSFLTAGTSDD